MTITHHPTDLTLATFAAGKLDEGRSVVVAAHVAICPACQRMTHAIEHMGGAHLQSLPEAALAADALPVALARLGQLRAPQTVRAAPAGRDMPVFPASLQPYELGPWRWMGPGVRWRSASVPAKSGARVFLLKAAPGTRLPHHTHTGTELTMVLTGAFAHHLGRFGAGDFEEADGSIEHQPVVEAGEDCICLVAMEGELQLLGFVGRVLQPFVRM